jgi:hypothetical protein
MFTQADKTGWAQSNAFKQAISTDVDIEFIGVWLVGAVRRVTHAIMVQ